MTITKAAYSEKKDAEIFVLENPIIARALDALISSGKNGLSPSELMVFLEHSTPGAASNLLKIMNVAEIAKPIKKQGVRQPYVVNVRGLFALAKMLCSSRLNEIIPLLKHVDGGAKMKKKLSKFADYNLTSDEETLFATFLKDCLDESKWPHPYVTVEAGLIYSFFALTATRP